MSFLSIPFWAVAAGAATLAVLLFALQILKARQKPVRIAAAALWAQAARVAPLRVFRQRFQRWLAYLLVLAIALTLWIAGARPELSPTASADRHVFYIDASAALTPQGVMEDATRALLADVRSVDPARRAVYLGDASATPLLLPGENVALLAQRLGTVEAQARPSTFDAFVASPKAVNADAARTVLHYYGGWPAANAARPLSGTEVALGYIAAPVSDNRGVVALGAAPAASGRADRADILVEAIDARGRSLPASALRFVQGGRPITPAIRTGPSGALVLTDVPANGQAFEVRLAQGDRFSADDRASLRLPDRRPVRVALSPRTPATIARAARLDAGLLITPQDQAQVVVRLKGEDFGADRPALELDASRTDAAFVLTYAANEETTDLVADAATLGLDAIDADALARTSGRAVSVEAREGARRGLTLWSLLVEDSPGFATSGDFPVFVGRALRWLTDPAPWVPYAAAGRDLVDQSDLYGLTADHRVAARALNGDLYLGRAGETRIGDLPVSVSLIDRTVTLDAAQPVPATARIARQSGSAIDLLFILLVAFAGLLLLLEWRLHSRGAMA